MIDPTQLKVGDVFYKVRETNDGLFRSKIHQEIDGVDWFRYDKSLRNYTILECTVLGILQKKLEGIWDLDDDYHLETEWYVENDDTKKVEQFVWDMFMFSLDDVFVDKPSALIYKGHMEFKTRELDKA